MMIALGVEGLAESNEIARNHLRALMQQLIERVLPVRAGLAPINRTRLIRLNRLSVERHALTQTLHRELLEICREALQVLIVRKDRDSLDGKKVVVPDGEQPHQDGQIAIERGRAEML